MIFKLFNQLSLKIMVEIALKSPPPPPPPPTPSLVISVVHLVTTIAVVECE